MNISTSPIAYNNIVNMSKECRQHDPLEGVTPEGMIVTGAHRERIVPEFIPIINQAVDRINVLGENCSLYLYGSVATGTAQVGYSDVDLIAINVDSSVAKNLSETLSKEFCDLCRSVEIGAGESSGYEGTDDQTYGNRVFLKHYCVHLTGPNISADFPEFPADKAAARGFNGDIGKCAEKWKSELSQGENLVSLARRIARKTLFTVTGLVSMHDNTWTTDRTGSAKKWKELKPELKNELDLLIAWSNENLSQVSDKEIQQILDGIVSNIVSDFTQEIGFWCP